MSRRRFFGEATDRAYFSPGLKEPRYKVVVWNPFRTTVSAVVLEEAQSPEYDITKHVLEIDYSENIIFENSDDSVATNCKLTVEYAPNARPIEITERTMLDNTPIRIFQGDARVDEEDWVPIFTGILRGNPQVVEFTRDPGEQKVMELLAVERSEAFLSTQVTAKSYLKGDDIGKSVVETAVQFMNLDRREVLIGLQNYVIGAATAQLVDIEILKGLAQMLFVVGKKPKFTSDGFLCAADTDLARAPARIHETMDLIISVTRQAISSQINNSVRLLGLDDELTEVVERFKRLAHGSITSGFFEDEVRERVSFSEADDKGTGARRAKNTKVKADISSVGDFFGEGLHWEPKIEDDGYTCFGGNIVFDTGANLEIRSALIGLYVALQVAAWAASSYILGSIAGAASTVVLLALLLALTETGRVAFEILGNPFQNVYQQICVVEQLANLLTSDVRELELKNDWFYDIPTMQVRCLELLKRELIKGWVYNITMIDDPLLEVDDILQIESRKYYITSIQKRLARSTPPDARMQVTAWRFA